MKSTITKKIILSYLIIIFITLAFAAGLFTLTARKFIESQVRNNLEKTADSMRRVLRADLSILKKDSNSDTYTDESNKVLQNIRDILRRSFVVQGSSYGIVTKDMKIIYPGMKNTEEHEKFKNQILPAIVSSSGEMEERTVKLKIDSLEYMSVVLAIPSRTDSTPGAEGWVVLYTAIEQMNDLGQGILIVLLGVLVFSGILAVTIGIAIARSIARPIVKLKKRAELLSLRDFDTKVEINTGDEIQELARTFNKMASELKDYDMGQKKFLQNASHELKTPLMSIQGYAEGLKDGVFDDREQALDVIIEESNRLKKIVEGLILLSKLETMEDYYNFKPHSMNAVIAKGVEKIASIAVKNNIEIKQKLCKDVVLNIDCDKFTQALINILGNCMRFATSEITIATSVAGKYFTIRIFDNGEGFDKKDVKNIFERFYKGKNGSTGLGLAITKVIVEKHDGLIAAYNNSDNGAEFKILLPLRQGKWLTC